MKNTKRKNKKLAALIAAAVVPVLAGAGFALHQYFFAIENQFPMWKEAEDAKDCNEVGLRLLEIDFAGPSISVSIENTTDGQAFYGRDYSVEFFHEGAWYIVYEPEVVPLVNIVLEAWGKAEESYSCPPETFVREGRYRLRVSSLGCCAFDIFFGKSGDIGYKTSENSNASSLLTKDGEDASGVSGMMTACGLIEGLTFSELAQTSTLVAYGQVTRVCEPALVKWVNGGSSPITDVEFSVTDVLRGEEESTVTVRTLGGLVNGVCVEDKNTPKLTEGQTCLLFLYQPGMGGGMNTEGDYYYLRGLFQGVYLPLTQEGKEIPEEDPLLVNCRALELGWDEENETLSGLEEQEATLAKEVSFSLSQLKSWCEAFNQKHPVDPGYFRRTILETYRFNVANDTMTQEECDLYTAQLDQYAHIISPEEAAGTMPGPEGDSGFSATSATAAKEPPVCDIEYADIPLGEILQKSKLILKGKYVGPQEAATHTDHVFAVLEVFRGSYDGSEISLCEPPDLPFVGCSYEADVEYLLVLTKESNVYKEHDVYYYPSSSLHVPLCPGAHMVVQGGRPLGKTEEEREFVADPIGFLAKVPSLTAEQEEEPLGTHYVLFDTWEEILPQCGYVLKLKIGSSVIKNEVWGTESFGCEVLNVYKGGEVPGSIISNFFDGTVEQGKEYIVLAERAGNEDSLVYPLAAKKDVVFPVGSADAKRVIETIGGGETK